MYTCCAHHSFRAAPRFLPPRVNKSNAKRRNKGRRISTTAKFGEPRNFDEDGVGGGDGDRDFYNNNNRRQQHQNNSSWREDGRRTMRGGDRGAREFDGRRNGDRNFRRDDFDRGRGSARFGGGGRGGGRRGGRIGGRGRGRYGEGQRRDRNENFSSNNRSNSREGNINPFKVMVGNLSYSTTDESLGRAMERFGYVANARVVLDRETGQSRGFGFVTFEDETSCAECVEIGPGMRIDDREVKVEASIDKNYVPTPSFSSATNSQRRYNNFDGDDDDDDDEEEEDDNNHAHNNRFSAPAMMRVLDRPSPSFLNSARETRNRGGFAADDADDADEERSANINAMSEDEFEDWVLEGLEDDLVDSRRQNRSDNGPYGDQNDEAREYVPTLLAKYVEDDFEPEMFVREPDDPDEYFFYSGAKFKDIGASELIVNALESRMNISRPSHIQAQSFKILLHDHSDSYDEESSVANDDEGANHVLLADQAGSGKTLSYLLPLLQRLERLERDSGMSVSKRPRALVLVPTSELARQVTEVVKELSKGGVRTRSMIATGGASDRTKINRAEQSTRDLTAKFTLTQTKTLKSGVDIVIGTPGRIRYLCETGRMELDDLDSIILDECDVLLGDAFEFASQIKPIKDLANPTSTRFVLVTATIPDQVLRELKQFFYPQDIRVIQGPGLHRPSAGTLERLVDCSGGDVSDEQSGFYRKYAALMKILRDDILPSTAGTTAKTSKKKSASRTLLFCNKIETCRKLENLLIRSDPDGASYKVLPYHAALSREKRDENLRKFLGRRSSSEKQRGEFTVDDDDSTPQLLICTDRASRGLDGKKIKHVVLFDFPRDPSEYVRRVGRTARGALGTGTVTALVIGRQLKLAREIMRRNSRGDPVEGTPTTT